MSGLPSTAPTGRSFASMPAADALEADRLFAQVNNAMFGGPTSVRLGRYVILQRLGSGAMGVVYEAEDPILDRTVALKVLHPDLQTQGSTGGHTRIRREARALGRVRHPNVVEVFDVGEADGRVYLAMELVTGRSLDDWLTEEHHPWATVVERFVQAARGLEAAHRVGVVHRDFKPSNVHVGDDGRVRVLDFGLAVPEPSTVTADPGFETQAPLAGTPHYMAPELFDGGEASPMTDQYAFCVALGEALDSATGPVPRSLQRVVARGRSAEAGARYRSMAEVIEALRRPPSRWRRIAGGVVVVSAIVGLGSVAGGRSNGSATVGPPRGGQSTQASSALETQTEHSPIRSKADQVWALLEQGQPREAVALGRDAVQEATASGDGELQATTRLALGVALDGAGETATAAEELQAAHGLAVTHRRRQVRLSAAMQLARLAFQAQHDVAAGTRWLREVASLRPLDPRQEYALAQLEVIGARAAGDPAAAGHAARRMVETAQEAFGPSRLLALAYQGLALAFHDEDRFADARGAGLEGLRIAEEALPPDDLAFEALYEALAAIAAAEATATGDGMLAAKAAEWSQRLVGAVSRRLGPGHFATATAEANAAELLGRTGNKRAAAEAFAHAMHKLEGLRGADDPQLALTAGNFGLLQAELGDLRSAEQLLERALIVLESNPGQRIAARRFLENLASVQDRLGEGGDRARARLDQLGDG